MVIIIGSLLSLAALAVIILLVVGGMFAGNASMQPWLKSYAKGFTDPRIQLVASAELAPNGHNMQPWNIELDKADSNVLYLYVDTKKLTPAVDPLYRQTLVSQGTFLEYMRVSGLKMGLQTSTTLFPRGQYDENNIIDSMKNIPVARVTLSKINTANDSLYDYMFLADTNRGSYKSTKLTADQSLILTNTSSDPIISVALYDDSDDLAKLGAYANAGTQIESTVERVSIESANVFRSNEYQKNQYRYGFSVEGQGTEGVMKYLLQGLITLFPSLTNTEASAKTDIAITQNAVSHTPAYALIVSKDNSRISQVQAGMTYSRLVLVAHSLGLAMQPPSQVLEEYPEMAKQYASIASQYAPDGGTIQMFFRLGVPTKQFPTSMRQDAMSFVR